MKHLPCECHNCVLRYVCDLYDLRHDVSLYCAHWRAEAHWERHNPLVNQANPGTFDLCAPHAKSAPVEFANVVGLEVSAKGNGLSVKVTGKQTVSMKGCVIGPSGVYGGTIKVGGKPI